MQCMAQPLVLDDGANVDLAEPVVALVTKALAVRSDLDLAVGVLVDVDVAVNQAAVGVAVLEQVDDLVVLQGEREGDLALHAPAEDQVQILVTTYWPVRVVVALGGLGEPDVEVGNEVRRELVGRLSGADLAQPQLLDQPVLQRQIGPFHASLCLARVGAQDVDVELEEGASELSDGAAEIGRLARRPEDARLVAVERHRLAVPLEVGPRGLEVREGRFGRREVQLHQPPGRVVDEDEQCACRGSAFEPSVVAAVDLDELAETGSAVARLVDRSSALAARLPQACGRHQRPHGLLGQEQPVALA